MKILFIGDIVGRIGRRMIQEKLPYFVNKYEIDFVIANGENSTHGKGLIKSHYEQLIDLGQELEENENNFFKQENLRYFRLFLNRMARLHDSSTSLRDYTVQLGDQYKANLDIRQNRIMTILTVVTTIFMPLTLIVGWYGMNFRYMPELEWRWGYPVIIVVTLLIAIGCLLFFKKKKWL